MLRMKEVMAFVLTRKKIGVQCFRSIENKMKQKTGCAFSAVDGDRYRNGTGDLEGIIISEGVS